VEERQLLRSSVFSSVGSEVDHDAAGPAVRMPAVQSMTLVAEAAPHCAELCGADAIFNPEIVSCGAGGSAKTGSRLSNSSGI
jgi:hypothetical protein